MKTAEKKLGIFQGIIRQNFQRSTIVGTGRVANESRIVSVDKEGNLVFWYMGKFDLTISSDDVVACELVESGKLTLSDGGEGMWYGPAFEITLTDNSVCRLTVNEFCVENAEYREPGVAEIPKVDGWLTADGKRDGHYEDAFCPEGYKANVIGYYKKKIRHSQLSIVEKALDIKNRYPHNYGEDGNLKGLYIFDGQKSTYYIKSIKRKV